MIRVLIERWLADGSDEAIGKLMRDLRREAIHVPGFVTGETLRDVSDHRHVVTFCTWRSREEWEVWAACAARREIAEQIRPMLAEPEKITICEPA